MPTRRDFLRFGAGVATLAALPRLSDAQEIQEPKGINESLQQIAELLRQEHLVTETQLHPVPSPTHGLVQWRWVHFDQNVHEAALIEILEHTNAQLLKAMQRVRTIPDAELDALMQEGFVQGQVEQAIATHQDIHRELISNMFTKYTPFSFRDFPPSEEKIDAELLNTENLYTPVNQVTYFYGEGRSIKLSPLARLGAGYALSLDGVRLDPAEDPRIDRIVEEVVRNGSEQSFKTWVIDERDKHFIRLVGKSRRRIEHLLVGCNHDLTDDVRNHNEVLDDTISHLIITVPGVKEHERYVEALRVEQEQQLKEK